jgi:hypothetical protein
VRGGLNVPIGACLVALWLYGASRPQLRHRPVSRAARRGTLGRIAMRPIVLGLLAITASLIHMDLSALLLLVRIL